MKTQFWLLSLGALLVINIAWLYKTKHNNQLYNQRLTDSRAHYIEVNRELSQINKGCEYAIKTDHQVLSGSIRVKSLENASGMLDDYLGQSEKLILVVSDHHCSTCVDQILFLVKNEIAEQKRDQVLVLFSKESSSEEQWNHRQKILPGVQFLEIQYQSLRLPMDSLGIPYFFQAGIEHLVFQAFAPYPALELQTKGYLNEIDKRLIN